MEGQWKRERLLNQKLYVYNESFKVLRFCQLLHKLLKYQMLTIVIYGFHV